MSERPVFVLIDGHAVAYRQFYAIKADHSFTTREGEPTNATFGFARFLLDLLQGMKPHYLAISFDQGLGGRDEWYPAYKGTRSAMPPDLVRQLPRIYELVSAFNIPVLELPNAEADDVIGTIVRQAEQLDVLTHIITGDRDILQLLSDNVQVQLPSFKGDDRVYDTAAFVEKYAIQPLQLIDLKALVGDTSDNIPGVSGIGDKTATNLLQVYGTLDNIYANLDAIKEQVRKKLIQEKDMAYLSQRLATIQTDLPIRLHLDECVAHEFDVARVDALFQILEFRRMRERLRAFEPTTAEVVAEPLTFFHETTIVKTPDHLEKLVMELNTAKLIVVDTETTGIDPMSAALVGISLATHEAGGYYIPVGHLGADSGTLFETVAEDQLPLDQVIHALRAPLTNPNIPKIAHNAVYDLLVLQNHGVVMTPITFDTMIAEWVRDPVSRFLGLKNFARQELNIHMTEISDLIGTGKKQLSMAQIAIDKVAPYAVADVIVALKAYQLLAPKLEDPQIQMSEIFYKLEMPMVPVVAQMESAGALLDLAEIQRQSVMLEQRMREVEAVVYESAGEPFNIGSPKQLNDILFTKMKLSVQGLKKTTHGYSTDISTLDALRSAHPIVEQIVTYRELAKLKSTYIDALPTLVNPRTGRVHTSYNQTGTSTGRFSSSNPNLQNIPIRTDLGREVRKVFIAPPGYTLLAVDYSQIELRVMAHISDDETLKQAFLDGQDIHRATAAAVYGVPLEAVTYEQRSFAKRVNFGLMYGMGAFRLSRDSNLTLAEADAFVKTYFERLPNVERYLKQTKEDAIRDGFVQTLFGRRRFFPRLQMGNLNSQDAQSELRAAINAPIQGTAADILKMAMLDIARWLPSEPDVRMTLQVHDELVFEVPDTRHEEIAATIVGMMQDTLAHNPIKPITFAVPLRANAECGKNWLDMHEVPL